jgi:hypothetical protein
MFNWKFSSCFFMAAIDPLALSSLVVAVISLFVSVIAAWANSMQVRLLSQQFVASLSPLLVCNLVQKMMNKDSIKFEVSVSNVGKENVIIGSAVLKGKSNVGNSLISIVAPIEDNSTVVPNGKLVLLFQADGDRFSSQIGDIGNAVDPSILVDFSVELVAWTPSQEALSKPATKFEFFSPFSPRLLS